MTAEPPSRGSAPYQPVQSPRPQHPPHNISLDLQPEHNDDAIDFDDADGDSPPPSLLSPAFTPPSTPGSETPSIRKRTKSFAVDSSTAAGPGPKLLNILPQVECVVRARIPTINGQEMFLHLYTNNIDNKEHLAIVFGPHIRSQSLDRERPGETEMDRMIRGAYTGRLFPGRISSHKDQIASIQKNSNGNDEPNPANPSNYSELRPLQPIKSKPASQSTILTTPEHLPSAHSDAQNADIPTPPLVRIHSECYTGETVWSARCDCGEQLDEAARLMSAPSVPPTPQNLSVPPSPVSSQLAALSDPSTDPGGVIIYLRQEGRGIGLSEKLKAYNLQDLGSDTVEANLLLRHPADARSYGLATSMLVDLGLGGDRGIRLMTNNPDKVRAVEGPGREVRVRERVAMVPLAWKTGGKQGIRSVEVESYLKTKIEQFGHMIGN